MKSAKMIESTLISAGQIKVFYQNSTIYSYPNPVSIQKLTMAQKSGAWKLTAWGYERLWRKQSVSILSLGKFHLENELEQLNAAVLLTESSNPVICDLTCSTGLYGRFLLDKFPESTVYFLDYSIEMLQEVLHHRPDHTRTVLVQAFCEDPVFEDSVLDAVVCGGSWNEITQIEKTLFRMYSALKPGGVMFWMGILPAATSVGRFFQKLAGSKGGLHFDESEKIEAAFGLAGFKSIQIKSVQPIFTLTARKPE
ncbi:MAG: class I SAM-dependent methyltransferase [Bacteroidetes bacterium]|nr:class I SAM-dependent methyltransferase [Bacteroidota bacterium]